MSDIKITFIIPSLGRISLKETMSCLLNQTNPNWNAIVVFDGIEPTIDINEYDSRVQLVTCEKIGINNHAGRVRNYGIVLAKTDWVAFVDDDDSLSTTYVDTFLEEIKYDIDTVIFRMNHYNNILPTNNSTNFLFHQVGISFAMKKSIFDAGIIFEPSCTEDYELLDKIRQNGYKIMISPYILYFVRVYNQEDNTVLNRAFINT